MTWRARLSSRCTGCGVPKVHANSVAALPDELRSAAVHAPLHSSCVPSGSLLPRAHTIETAGPYHRYWWPTSSPRRLVEPPSAHMAFLRTRAYTSRQARPGSTTAGRLQEHDPDDRLGVRPAA